MLHGGVEGIKFAAGIDINIVWGYIPDLDNITFLRIFVLKTNNLESELEKCCPRTYLAFLYPLKRRVGKLDNFGPSIVVNYSLSSWFQSWAHATTVSTIWPRLEAKQLSPVSWPRKWCQNSFLITKGEYFS